MLSASRFIRVSTALALVAAIILSVSAGSGAQSVTARSMTFLDMQQLRSAGSATPSPDGASIFCTGML